MVLSAAEPENIRERVRELEPANLNPYPGPFPPPPPPTNATSTCYLLMDTTYYSTAAKKVRVYKTSIRTNPVPRPNASDTCNACNAWKGAPEGFDIPNCNKNLLFPVL